LHLRSHFEIAAWSTATSANTRCPVGVMDGEFK